MSRKKLASWWVQIAAVAILAVASAFAATSLTPFRGIVSAVGNGGGRTDIAAIEIDHSQSEILADGVVTRAEYDAAVNQTLACVRASGGEITDLRYEDFRDRPIYTFGIEYNHFRCPPRKSPLTMSVGPGIQGTSRRNGWCNTSQATPGDKRTKPRLLPV
jgi:hypothetical protein